jgi:dipeptidase E
MRRHDMDLILSGGGNPAECKEVDAYYKKLVKGKRHLLYLPTAWQMHFDPRNLWAMGTITRVSKSHETWLSLRYKTAAELKRFDTVYVGGGNTFALLAALREGSSISLLKKTAGRVPVYGSSAGAIIFGVDIGTASFGGDADENLPKLKDLRGMDMLHGYAVGCHYRPIDDAHYRRYAKKHPVIALPNETGLHVQRNKITVIGRKSAFLFENGEKIELPVGSVATYAS